MKIQLCLCTSMRGSTVYVTKDQYSTGVPKSYLSVSCPPLGPWLSNYHRMCQSIILPSHPMLHFHYPIRKMSSSKVKAEFWRFEWYFFAVHVDCIQLGASTSGCSSTGCRYNLTKQELGAASSNTMQAKMLSCLFLIFIKKYNFPWNSRTQLRSYQLLCTFLATISC